MNMNILQRKLKDKKRENTRTKTIFAILNT